MVIIKRIMKFDFKQVFYSIYCKNIATFSHCLEDKLLLGVIKTIMIGYLGLNNSNLDSPYEMWKDI